ncbi:MAG: hypothetical protein PHV68_03285 [Candidatus Gastranaerophilales bacterium]|nr:hypothetical protein [Candidatus Gastranaerophilales bacterium]
MKKNIILFITLIMAFFSFSTNVLAQIQNGVDLEIQSLKYEYIDNVSHQEDIGGVKKLLYNYLKYANAHNIEGLSSLYANDFVSGDGIKKNELMDLVSKTWKNYPDMSYSTIIKEVKLNKDFATVETIDITKAATAKSSAATDDTGFLAGESHSFIYLRKFATDWKVISDKIISESTVLKFGSAKNYEFQFHSPEQVFAGKNYTAILETKLSASILPIASITKEPIVYPEIKTKEVFRQVNPNQQILERVIKANCTNNNELVIASVGLTELVKDIYMRVQPKLTGMAILIQRVNVIPESKYIPLIEEPEELDIDGKEDTSDNQQ